MEYLYYGFGALLVVGLVVLLVRVQRWIGQSTSEGLQETLRFAEVFGLESLDAEGHNLKGTVEDLPVILSEGAILVKAHEGMIGRMRTLRVIVQAAKGQWLLCERELSQRLNQPLPELGEEHTLNEPRAAQRFLLRYVEDPLFGSDSMLLDALADTELKIGRGTDGRTTLDFVAPAEFVGGLGGAVATLTRLLMVSLALAVPHRSRHFLGEASAYR